MFKKISQFRIYLLLVLLLNVPFKIIGQNLTLAENEEKVFYGRASYYGDGFAGNRTANGEIFDPAKMTAAHRYWPFQTIVKVTNLANSRSIVVRINDRGPFIEGRHIDLSEGVAKELGFIRAGVTDVRMEIISWGKNDPEQYAKIPQSENSVILAKTEPKKSKSTTRPIVKKEQSKPATIAKTKDSKVKTTEIYIDTLTIVNNAESIVVNTPPLIKVSVDKKITQIQTPEKPKEIVEHKQIKQSTIPPIEMKRSRWMCMESDTLSGWCIQIGAFALKANAMITYDKVLELTNDWVCIQEIDRSESLLYRVIASKTMDYDSCKENLEKIRAIYPEAFITSYVNLRLTASK